jgi:DNA-binding transcriptional MerR regulator
VTRGDEGTLTVGRLAARFGLSRTTLLHYDRIGLLRPSGRTAAGYRRYGPADVARLADVRRLRAAGLPLEVIARLLDSPTTALVTALALRLAEIDEQVAALRAQQRSVLDALTRGLAGGRSWTPDGDELVGLLAAAGVTADGRTAWHRAAEDADGDAHQALLEALALPPDDVARVRRHASSGPAVAADRPRCEAES